MSRSAAPTEALLREPGVPAGSHSGQAAFCHHLVETGSRDRPQAEQGVWGHSFTSSVVPVGVSLGLVTQFSRPLGGRVCLAAQFPPSPGQQQPGKVFPALQGSGKHRGECLLCQKLGIHGKSLLGSLLNQLNSL